MKLRKVSLKETIKVNSEKKNGLNKFEDTYKDFLESFPVGVLEIDYKTKQISHANLKFLQIIGYSLEEILKEDSRKVIHPDDLKSILSSSGEKELEFRLMNKDEKTRWVHGKRQFHLDQNGDILKIQIWLQDIEKQIKNPYSELSQICNSTLPMYATDLNYNVLFVNDSFCDYFKTKRETFQGRKCHDVWKSPLCDTEDCSLKKLLSGQNKFEYEIDKVLSDGNCVSCIVSSTPYLDSDGKMVGIVKTFTDITARKKIEQALKDSEEKYRMLFKSSRDGILLASFDGKILECNQAFLEMVGYKITEVKEFNLFHLTPDESQESIESILSDHILVRGYSDEFEMNLIKKNGRFVLVNMKFWLNMDELGNVSALWAIIRDITERKKAEELKDKFNKKLEEEVILRTNELNSALKKQELYLDEIIKGSRFKSEFLATMSHELRTPLNAIIGFTDLLIESVYGDLNEKQLEFLNYIKSSAEHQFNMIQQILDITKIESGQLKLNIKEFSLNNIMDQVNSTFKSAYTKKNLKFLIKGSEHPIEIRADPIRFKEILFNLVDNAIKFTMKGRISLIIQEKSDRWIFKVKDTGIGIAKKDHDIIFKEFKRVKSPEINAIQGTGLGLSLTKRLVNLHGGEITFTSVVGIGTTFTFFIPKNAEKMIKEKRTLEKVEDFLGIL